MLQVDLDHIKDHICPSDLNPPKGEILASCWSTLKCPEFSSKIEPIFAFLF